MQVADVEMVRAVRRDMGRHCIDVSEVIVSAMHGVVHLNGRVRPCRGHEADFEQEVHAAVKTMRQRSGVRDVIQEWTCPDAGYNIGVTSRTRPRS